MSRLPIPLVERLRQGLASAVISAAALSTPLADAASPQQPKLAESPASASRPAARGQAATPHQTKPLKQSPSAKPKTQSGGKGASSAAAGCGAHDGGCGPSR